MSSEMDEEILEWECWHCKGDIGSYPRGIRVICPICKAVNILPGMNVASIQQSKEIERIKETVRKDALKRYRAMRER